MKGNNWQTMVSITKGQQSWDIIVNPSNGSMCNATDCSLAKTLTQLSKAVVPVVIHVKDKKLFKRIAEKEDIDLKQYKNIIKF